MTFLWKERPNIPPASGVIQLDLVDEPTLHELEEVVVKEPLEFWMNPGVT